MPAAFTVGDGGPLEPDKFVIRRDGMLVRAEKGLPLLFVTKAQAETEAERLVSDEPGVC